MGFITMKILFVRVFLPYLLCAALCHICIHAAAHLRFVEQKKGFYPFLAKIRNVANDERLPSLLDGGGVDLSRTSVCLAFVREVNFKKYVVEVKARFSLVEDFRLSANVHGSRQRTTNCMLCQGRVCMHFTDWVSIVACFRRGQK